MSVQNNLVNKGDRNKIYFLVVVIAALLGTNAYLFFKDKHETKRFVSVSTEKDRLQLEVEKIEVELDNVNNLNVSLSEKLLAEQNQAREKISQLKIALQQGVLTKEQLEDAKKEIRVLKEFVKSYSEKILKLEGENSDLKTEVDSLQAYVNNAGRNTEELTKKNAELNEKVKTGSALKASNVGITAYKVKNSGKNIVVTKAGTAKKLIVSFDIVPNQLAKKDYHKIYLRVFDPAGNLIADSDNMFQADGQEMQYSSSTSISFNDDNTSYSMDWINPNKFIKGQYSIILYADGFTMGRAEIILK
ncbi:hypothetical protein [Pedobacter metabolipauper]|uniref:Uncharacterized protein n=1 Tax=Pedobacter metabolipauper TaxID=425513 RepID=A0A4R6SV66_9SPHI|nr:hypothetical protein [Pedobacter metabolipauper]TDQ09738.1 hypothetical protein ATK78_1896 [Pedobacter metabolipauper]